MLPRLMLGPRDPTASASHEAESLGLCRCIWFKNLIPSSSILQVH